jgi:DNA invertase Pin-like site-specific DNA recombinase
MRIGYGRVSTTDQNLNSQEDALKAAGVERLYVDRFTGTKVNRPELDRLREQLRDGDVVVVTRLDRLGRSTKDLLDLVSQFDALGVQLEVVEQSIDTSTAEGRLFFTMVAAFAEFERSIMQARTKDGLAAARARGRVGGRKLKLTKTQIAMSKKSYADGIAVAEIARSMGVSRPTIYRTLSEAV